MDYYHTGKNGLCEKYFSVSDSLLPLHSCISPSNSPTPMSLPLQASFAQQTANDNYNCIRFQLSLAHCCRCLLFFLRFLRLFSILFLHGVYLYCMLCDDKTSSVLCPIFYRSWFVLYIFLSGK